MNAEPELITVYCSTEVNAEQDATAVRNLLMKEGLNPLLFDGSTPGVVSGSWEVRVPAVEVTVAEAVITRIDEEDPESLDPSHDLDMVTVAETQGATGELEAISIKSILDANGINTVLVGSSTLPNLSFMVNVAAEDVERARQAIEEARAAGPAAAVEAERQSEDQRLTER